MSSQNRPIRSGVGSGPVLVTASDTVADPNGPFTGMYLDSATAVRFTDANGNTCGPVSPTPNVVHPFPFSRVWATGTTDASKVYGIQAGSN